MTDLAARKAKIVDIHLARRRMKRSLYWRRDRDAKKYPPEFLPFRVARVMRSKRTLYGRHLRIANTPMIFTSPKWWFLGHPDFHELNRNYEREFGRPLDEATRLAHKAQRDWWDNRMGYKK
jgi:hypothetical protein